MNSQVINSFRDKADHWVSHGGREEYIHPYEHTLFDIFLFSSYDYVIDSDTWKIRQHMLEAIENGFVAYRERIPHYNTDLFRLTYKGVYFILEYMEFEKL